MKQPPQFTEVNVARLAELSGALGHSASVVMVNLLRFREVATYQLGSAHDACSGRDAYFTRYMPGVQAIIEGLGGSELVFPGIAHASLVGPEDEQWDAVGVVRYPRLDVFEQLINDPQYINDVAPHRLAALEDWRLYATTELS